MDQNNKVKILKKFMSFVFQTAKEFKCTENDVHDVVRLYEKELHRLKRIINKENKSLNSQRTMLELKGFYKEETLEELLFKGNITRLEFIYHHSQERINDYKTYCTNHKLAETEESAEAYTNFILEQEEKEHTEMFD